ncbi:GGDEF domain-containing protein [Ruminococcus sp. YE71]|uniref:GGDEF domain-containing protein n=2 Tax=unclassified Ruminococcus TaxID=2608920 RepID=UPI001586260E|nr:GGDEF domain-containing protein [Ruminococcus sp. YE71]
MGKSATIMMSEEFDHDKVQLYMEKNFELEEYNEIRENLVFLKSNYPDVLYMYVYHFVPEGGEVIFDLDSDYSLDADPPGTIYEPDPAVVPYLTDLCEGKEIPVLTGDTVDGYMLTYMRPVFDSKGNYCCHVCVDFSVEKLHRQDINFVLKMLALLVLITLLIALIDVHTMQKMVTGPINRMKQATDKFAYETETDHQNNIAVMEQLDIRTGDEIEDIYHLFVTFMKNNLKYMQNLSQAEKDIRFKNAQIGQISLEAYKDNLTGVGSKAAYIKKAAELEEAMKENDSGLAVVMVDLNNLKRINDEHGHKAGDTYISGCCRMICETFKHSPVYRIGGDEFVAILKGQDFDDRERLAGSLSSAFTESFGNSALEPWLRYSAAVGMAEQTPDDSTFESLFQRADQAMYEAKNAFKAKYGSYR